MTVEPDKAVEGVDDTEEQPTREHSRRVRLLVLAALLLFGAVIQVGHVARYQLVSPIDELQHLDYLIRAPSLDIPGSGDKVGQEAARAETCSRIDNVFDLNLMPCTPDDQQVDVSRLQEQGFNTAFIHPPTYYFVDGVVARVIDVAIPGHQGPLTTGRLAGVVWTLAAVAFLWLLMREMRAGLLATSVVIVIVITAPTVMHAASTINPDGTSVAMGAAMLWAAVRWERRRTGAWLLVLFAALSVGTKVTNLAGVGVALAYLAWPMVRSLPDRWRARSEQPLLDADDKKRLLAVGLPVAAVLVVALAWRLVQNSLQIIPSSQIPMVIPVLVDRFPLADFGSSWHYTFSPLQSAWLAPFLRTRIVTFMGGVGDFLVVAGAFAGAVLAGRATRERRLGVIALVAIAACGPALVVFNYVVQSIFTVIPPRYGLSIVPALGAAAVPALRRRSGLVIGTAFALFASGVVLSAMAFA